MRTELLGLSLLLTVSCSDSAGADRPPASAQSASSTAATTAKPSANAASSAAERYSCPMHEDIEQYGPGKCPKCGMDLELSPLGPAVSASAGSSASATGSAAAPPGDYRISFQNNTLTVGERADIELTMLDPAGNKLKETDFKIAHEQRIHLLIVDASLTDYHHEHPVPAGDGTTLTFDFTPTKPGPYRVFADVIPLATRKHRYLVEDLRGAGTGEPISRRATSLESTVDGLAFKLTLPAELKQGETANGQLDIRDAKGATLENLEPLMGAYAHIVGFSEDRSTVEHIHPLGKEPTKETDRGKGALQFRLTPTKAGLLRLFAQVKVEGKERFAPFTVTVLPK